MGFTSPVQAAVRSAGAAVDRLDRILCSLETLGGSIASMERDMRGMRKDLVKTVAGIEALRDDLRSVDGSVTGIRDATGALEQQVLGLSKSLRRIDALVPRLSRRSRSAGHADAS